MKDLSDLLVSPDQSLRDVIARIDRNQRGIALVVDSARRLLGTITDGDVRRALLSGLDLALSAGALLEGRPKVASGPLTAPSGTSTTELLELMRGHDLRHIPLIDMDGRVSDIAILSELVDEYRLPLRALVMAGGFGTRLKPLTDELPKAMLPIGDRPLLEHIVRQLQSAGIHRVSLATHYRADVIEQHFGDGRDFSVDIQYVNEDQPLGTAGALGLMAPSDEPLLVMNGDILTSVDFRAMLEFHREHHADLTMAVRSFDLQVPYGIVDTDGARVVRISEKPMVQYLVNAGIYLLNPDVCRHVPSGRRYDMTDLVTYLLAEGRNVISFPVREYWVDIGQQEQYEQAQHDSARERR
ncbi:MAG: nucleotidyltransferase family protein [Acidobacteriota bacterium]